ncbi:MAG: hypothetical protein AAF449_20285 [Myxococcota bacterium]
MSDETRLKEKLQAIEALFAGATTPGERDAAGAARERIKKRLAELISETPEEWRFTSLNTWELRLLLALAKRYDLKPFRYKGQRRTTVVIKGPSSFMKDVFNPEFNRMAQTLFEHLDDVARRVISEVIATESEDDQQLLLMGTSGADESKDNTP